MKNHRICDHLLAIWDFFVGFDSVEKDRDKILREEGRFRGIRETAGEMETDSLIEIVAKSTVPDAKGLEGVPQDEVDRITCKEEVASIDRCVCHAWIVDVNRLAEA